MEAALAVQARFTAGGYDPLRLNPGEFLFYFADIFVILVQQGRRAYLCDNVLLGSDATLQQRLDSIVQYTKNNGITVD